MKDIFIIGCKGIPAQYGGFETFVDQLMKHRENKNLRYHVACLGEKYSEREYEGVHCFTIGVPDTGAAKAVYYDVAAYRYCIQYCKNHRIKQPVIYILACRIGPFAGKLNRQFHRLGGKVYVNPDGHEWLRAKWSKAIRKYWKMSEQLMVKHADMLICDSKNIEAYIKSNYQKYKPDTTYLSYGAKVHKSPLQDEDEKWVHWKERIGVLPYEYYLIVGRFVPENNYVTMIREFMKSHTEKKLVIITNVQENSFYEKLKESTRFEKDARIIFAGTVYDEALLKKIREQAFGYLHGHEVGGTNPSLLEALSDTEINLLYDVGFNREVAEDAALYWNKKKGNLAALLEKADLMQDEERMRYGEKAKKRIREDFSWRYITDEYEKLFEKAFD